MQAPEGCCVLVVLAPRPKENYSSKGEMSALGKGQNGRLPFIGGKEVQGLHFCRLNQ